MALTYLDGVKTRHPSLPISALEDDFRNKLWHQLTTKLDALITLPEFAVELAQPTFYTAFLEHLLSKLNPMALARFVVASSRATADAAAASALLDTVHGRLGPNADRPSMEAKTHLLSERALRLARSGDLAGARAVLDLADANLRGLAGADTAVYVAFYLAGAELEKALGHTVEFYAASVLLLAYVPTESASALIGRQFAFDLCVAALVGEKLMNFGELASQPALAILRGTEQQWALLLVEALATGQLPAFRQLCATHAAAMAATPALAAAQSVINEKASVIALMEYVFSLPSDERVVPFGAIAERVQVPLDEVELVAMRAMSLSLIRGHMDQVQQQLTVSWVKPRTLGREQVAALSERLKAWEARVATTLSFLETNTPDLLQS